MEAGDVLRAAYPIAQACRAAGIPFIVNDRPDVALAVGAGVHLGQNDVSVSLARRVLGDAIVGLSTHVATEIDDGLSAPEPPDYVAVGPVFPTPTKPGRPAVGLELVRYAAANVVHPWFAIGGINASNLSQVVDAGARRIVVVRAIADALDPVAATAKLRARLGDAPPSEGLGD